jgi:hypothetical protein
MDTRRLVEMPGRAPVLNLVDLDLAGMLACYRRSDG